MERFAAPWERSLRITTGLFVALLLVATAVVFGLDLRVGFSERGPGWALWLAPAVLAAVVLLTWALSPRAFAIEGGELTVVRALLPVRIPLASVRAVAVLDRREAGPMIKVAGSGGVFGHYGRYWTRALGPIRLYATRRDRLVVVDTEAGRFVLTPATPERFVEALRRAAPQAGAGLGALTPAPAAGGWKLVAGIIAGVGAILAAILLVAAARAPLAVTVGPDAIRIERRWAEPVLLPLTEVREVAPLPPERATGWRRVNGVGGLGNASYGAFTSKALGPFTLYAWRRGPYVLLETAGGRVVLTPEDPPAFVADVQARLPR